MQTPSCKPQAYRDRAYLLTIGPRLDLILPVHTHSHIQQSACCMHAMQEHLIGDPLGPHPDSWHTLYWVLISDLYPCSCWPGHTQTTVVDCCTSSGPFQTLVAMTGPWSTNSITKKPCSLSNDEVFSSPLPSRARRQHPPRSTTAAISRKQGGWQINPALTKSHWPGVVCWPDRTRCPPLRLCTVKPEDCHYTDRRASSLPEYSYLPAHCLISPGNRLIYGMEPY